MSHNIKSSHYPKVEELKKWKIHPNVFIRFIRQFIKFLPHKNNQSIGHKIDYIYRIEKSEKIKRKLKKFFLNTLQYPKPYRIIYIVYGGIVVDKEIVLTNNLINQIHSDAMSVVARIWNKYGDDHIESKVFEKTLETIMLDLGSDLSDRDHEVLMYSNMNVIKKIIS